jgi:6-phosphogluconolactonase (cycloisomerase 2 family)
LALAVFGLVALAACGGPDTSGAPTPTPAAGGRFLYVASPGSAEVWAYAIDASTGGLTPVDTTSFPVGESPAVLAADPQGRFLWVAMTGAVAGLRGFAIDRASGALRELAGSPFDSGHQTDAIDIDPQGRFLAGTRFYNLALSTFEIDGSNGVLTPLATAFAPGFPQAPTLHPTARFLFLSASSPDAIDTYALDAAGRLATASSLRARAPDVVRGLAIDPRGSHLYATTATPFSSDTLFLYRLDPGSGSLTRVPGSAFAPGFDFAAADFRPDFVTFHPSGRFAYVSDRPGRTGARSLGYWVFPVQTSGLLGPSGVGPVTTPGRDPAAFAVEPSGRFAYATDATADTVSAFSIDATTGALVPTGATLVTGRGPVSIAVAP